MKNYIQHIIEPKKLLLAWQAPEGKDRTRYIVAELERTGVSDDSVVLRYLIHTTDFDKAKKLGFDGHPAFKKLLIEHSVGVVDALMRRLPPRTRGDFSKYLDLLRLPATIKISDFALLGYSGARLPSDGFSIIHPFQGNIQECEFLMEVAGFRYISNLSVDDIIVGTEVFFKPEPDNPFDPRAIMVMIDRRKIGYVNRGLLDSFHQWIKETRLHAWVERTNGSAKRPLVYLFVKVSKPALEALRPIIKVG